MLRVFKTPCMLLTNHQKNQHLLWRAGFGPSAVQLEELKKQKPEQTFKALQKKANSKTNYIDVADEELKEARTDSPLMKYGKLTAEERRERQKKSRKGIRD